MSVFHDNRGRGGDYRAPHRAQHRGPGAFHDPSRARWSVFAARRPSPPRRPEPADAPLWGLSYERAETLIQVVLAFALVGGATAALHSTLLGASPPPPAPEPAPIVAPAPVAAPLPAPSAAPVAAPAVAEAGSSPSVAAPEAPPPGAAPAAAAPAPQLPENSEQPAAVRVAPDGAAAVPASLLDARPIADQAASEPDAAPQPLAPPSAEMRERLAAREAPPASEPDTALETAAAGAAPLSAEEGGRLTRCFLKLSARSHESSACRIRRSEQEVVFQFADKTLTFTHERGRAWIATLGGRKIGRVYQNARKPCWGARGFYACDNT